MPVAIEVKFPNEKDEEGINSENIAESEGDKINKEENLDKDKQMPVDIEVQKHTKFREKKEQNY